MSARGLAAAALIGLLTIAAANANDDNLDPDATTMTREAWQARIREARERAEIARRTQRYVVTPLPTPDDLAALATRRILTDDSLQPGDLVTTDKGLFRFEGRPDRPRSDSDFVRVR